MLHCLLNGGLCNRLQCMESAIRLARDGHTTLNLYWVIVPDAMREFFSEIFCPLPSYMKLCEYPTYKGGVKHLFSWKNPFRYNPVDRSKLIQCCLNHRTNFLTAYYDCESFYPPRDGSSGYEYSWLKPSPDVQRRIDVECAKISGATIGVHVRRTDNKWSTEHSREDSFFLALDKEVDIDSNVRIYLASDDEMTKERFVRRYGKRIKIRKVKVRHSEGSVADAAVDLMLLSTMKKIYGSYRSSFSSVAARIRNIPLVVVGDQ